MESTLGFAGQMVSVTKTQLCHYRVKAATDHMYTNGCGYVSIKLYVQAREEVQIWLEVCSLPTLVEILPDFVLILSPVMVEKSHTELQSHLFFCNE